MLSMYLVTRDYDDSTEVKVSVHTTLPTAIQKARDMQEKAVFAGDHTVWKLTPGNEPWPVYRASSED